MTRERLRMGMFSAALLVMVLLPATLPGQEGGRTTVGGRVTYVTSTQVFGDIGRGDGLRENDTVRVLRDGTAAAVLLVTHLASRSFSSRILSRTAVIVKGDSLQARVHSIVSRPRPQLLRDSTAAPPPVVRRADAPPPSPPAQSAMPPAARVRGRVSMQYYALFNSAVEGAAFSQPAAVLNFTADDVMQLPLRVQYYSNHRYDARGAAARSGVARDRWRHRFYQFSLRYGEDDGPLTATAGRFVPYAVGGIGSVDGLMLEGRRGGWEGGVIAGAQPGYRDTELSLRDQKIAAYAGYRNEGESIRQRSSLAFAQTYRDGALDRGYFYLVNSVGVGRAVTLYQNASVDLYDVDDGGGHFQPHLTDLYFSATYRPQRWMSLTASYANRRSVYFLRSFASVPDTLFRTARLKNYQLSAGFNIPGGMYASLTGSLRTQENSDKTAAALAGRFTWSNLLDTRSNVYLLGSWADNIFNTSTSYGVEINRDLLEGLYGALRLQQYRYRYSQGDRSLDRTTLSLETYYRLSSMFYLSLSYEHYWEAAVTNDRIYSEISMRLR